MSGRPAPALSGEVGSLPASLPAASLSDKATLATILATFINLETSMQRTEDRLDTMEGRLGTVENSFALLAARVGRIDGRLTAHKRGSTSEMEPAAAFTAEMDRGTTSTLLVPTSVASIHPLATTRSPPPTAPQQDATSELDHGATSVANITLGLIKQLPVLADASKPTSQAGTDAVSAARNERAAIAQSSVLPGSIQLHLPSAARIPSTPPRSPRLSPAAAILPSLDVLPAPQPDHIRAFRDRLPKDNHALLRLSGLLDGSVRADLTRDVDAGVLLRGRTQEDAAHRSSTSNGGDNQGPQHPLAYILAPLAPLTPPPLPKSTGPERSPILGHECMPVRLEERAGCRRRRELCRFGGGILPRLFHHNPAGAIDFLIDAVDRRTQGDDRGGECKHQVQLTHAII